MNQFDKAKEYIRLYGHTKNGFYGRSSGSRDIENPPACLFGAVAKANNLEEEYGKVLTSPAAKILSKVASEQFPDRIDEDIPSRFLNEHRPAVAFNDHPDTTPQDIFLVLEKASVMEEEHVS